MIKANWAALELFSVFLGSLGVAKQSRKVMLIFTFFSSGTFILNSILNIIIISSPCYKITSFSSFFIVTFLNLSVHIGLIIVATLYLRSKLLSGGEKEGKNTQNGLYSNKSTEPLVSTASGQCSLLLGENFHCCLPC